MGAIAPAAMPFEIVVHERERILEIIYPPRPTAEDIDDYVRRVRSAIERLGGTWSCLVDQRKVQVLPPELVDRASALNAFAEERGMRRSARVVASAMAGLQARRLGRGAG